MTAFFEDGPQIRAWFKKHHAKSAQLKVGFRKGRHASAGLQWEQACDEALRYGWICGPRKSIDSDTEYCVFHPSRPGEKWPAQMSDRAQALQSDPNMTDAGRAAFATRKRTKSAKQNTDGTAAAELPMSMIAELKRHNGAWSAFQKLPPAHKQKWTLWVVSAKLEETRASRFAKLMLDLSRPR